ncbi:hypothetical protein MVI01_00130 [Myxococcus virescens]|uniref:Uncharacterized protein n=1 Tax=Myxococcus virescens TaxID=83456 RepID=A0A511H5Y8_9BACT|nr:hypothetical protein MVI01_00130 [Myxococcus virescens]
MGSEGSSSAPRAALASLGTPSSIAVSARATGAASQPHSNVTFHPRIVHMATSSSAAVSFAAHGRAVVQGLDRAGVWLRSHGAGWLSGGGACWRVAGPSRSGMTDASP